jgi:hypothetical protein
MTAAYERRELKHRASGETRPVPIHSELVTLIRDHMKEYRAGHGGPHIQPAARRDRH